MMTQLQKMYVNAPANDTNPSNDHALAIDIKNLNLGYGKKTVLQNLSLEVPMGSIYALLGPNGTGKTSLLKTLMGLMFATSGQVKVLGFDLNTRGTDIRTHTAFVSDSVSLFGSMNALEHFQFGIRMQPRWDQKMALDLCQQFDLPLKTILNRLSTGKKAILALIYALASKPKLMLLDEPTNGLDPAARVLLFKLLIGFVADGGTLVLASHVLGEVESIADHVGIMHKGQLRLHGNLDELRSRFKVVQMILDHEPTESEIQTLSALKGVSRIKVQGRMVQLYLTEDATSLPLLLEPRFQPKDLQILSRTLEEIYLEQVEGVTT